MSQLDQQSYHTSEIGERPWGRWTVLDAGLGFTVKKIEIEPGHRLSLQYHHHRSEHWLVIEGEGLVELDDQTILIKQRSHVHIPLKSVHRVKNTGTNTLIILELQQGGVLDERDIVRLEDDYARD